MIKSKKQMYVVIGAFVIALMLFTTTYAFFNYTRTGTANTIKTGRIAFNSQQGTAINLTNMFPIDPEENGIMDDDTKVGTVTINVTGDTTYGEGLEYLVTAVNVTNTVGSKALPISINVSVTNNSNNDPATTLGTSSSDYFDNRGGDTSYYSVLAGDTINTDDQLLIGYIAPGADGVDGNIVIKAYLDKNKIAISDTYPEGDVTHIEGEEPNQEEVVDYTNGTTDNWVGDRVVFTTTEWNSLQTNGVSFQVKVEANEGIWVTEPIKLSKEIKRKSSEVNYIVNYDEYVASNQNYSTYTTYDTVETNSNKQTVYYYTGADAAANSNVLFAGFCWQIIRTTDDGGVKLLYNGLAVNNKCETTRTVTRGINGRIGETASMSSATLYGRNFDYNLETRQFTIKDSIGLPTSWTTSDNNNNGIADYKELIGTYTCLSNSDTCMGLYYVGGINPSNTTQAYVASYSIGNISHYSLMGSSPFNPNVRSMALVGYMFNEEYDFVNESVAKSGEYFSTATWNGTSYDLTNGNGKTKLDDTHHYICDSDCTTIRYYYSEYTYMLLENGMTVDDLLYHMIGYGSDEIKSKPINANYDLNIYNSAIKGYLDNWYKNNLKEYENYLDNDTVYCNNRGVDNVTGGWNPNSSLGGVFQFNNYNIDTNLTCLNEFDRFSVNNSKAKLTYPIGLLTQPEKKLMTSGFATSGPIYWSGSPRAFFYYAAANIPVFADPLSDNYYNVNISHGIRGVVTLSPNILLDAGSGTYIDPYIVGPIVDRNS